MEKLNQILQEYIDKGKYPGIEWKINYNNNNYQGKVGYKNLETQEILEKDTIYRIWSMTKPIIAVAAMQLIENNIIELEEPINKYLPEFSNLKVLNNQGEVSSTSSLEKYPTIKDLIPEEPNKFLELLLESIYSYRKTSLSHGDLSEYNILNVKEKPCIIDVGQAVPKEHPMYEELHKRDMNNMYRFWKKHIEGLKLEDLQ